MIASYVTSTTGSSPSSRSGPDARSTSGHSAAGRRVDLAPADGDLLVMGGRCQRAWEHGVPKVARAGLRVSVTWRTTVPEPDDVESTQA